MTQLPRGRRPNRSCSEYAASVEHLTPHTSRGGAGKLAIGERCAGVPVWDGTKYRGLRTQEWPDLITQARWYPVIEEREAVLDRLTEPPQGIPSLGDSDHPGTINSGRPGQI